jgi:signal transduction histidine kinase
MAPRKPWSIRVWLGSFAAAVALPLLVLLIWTFAAQVQREQLAARDRALRAARATASRLTSMQSDSIGFLERMAARPPIRDFDGDHCDSLFAIVDFFPQYVNLFLFDDRQSLVCAASPESAGDRILSAVAQRWIESELRAGHFTPRRPVLRAVGSPWISVVTMPVTSSDGLTHRTLALVEIPEIAGAATLPAGTVITILDRQGTILARSDAPERWVGRSGRGIEVVELALQQKEGRAQARGVDGVLREYGFTSIPALGWSIYVGIPTSAVMQPVRSLFLRGLLGGMIVILLVIGVAMLLSRSIEKPVNALAQAAQAAGEGAYGTVSLTEPSPREITTLANAFNDMVASRSEFERRIRESQRDLKALSERLLEIQEEERTRIARAIHDDLGQLLTALKMDVLGLLAKDEAPSPIRDRIVRTLDATVTAVQRIATELRPSMLDDLGLIPAIESEARLFEERTGIECDVSMPHEPIGLDPIAATAIYRIVQEALTNVFRHSNASRVELRLRQRPDELLLEIRDDGRGMTADEISNPASLGLIGIRERAMMVGGTVEFEGVAGSGTIVSVRLPAPAITARS